MNFRKLYDFLRDLNTGDHNDKSWMDEHRSEYEEVRDSYISFLGELNEAFKKIDPDYQDTSGRKAINRINNNKMFHPEKPTYKNHFGASLDKGDKRTDYYIHLGINESFVACGFYHVPSDMLKLIRQEIDYNGEELDGIINEPKFKKRYGDIWRGDALKTTPKGYDKNHPRINTLKLKSFVAQRNLTQKEVNAAGFKEDLIRDYEIMLPFRRYLERAVEG